MMSSSVPPAVSTETDYRSALNLNDEENEEFEVLVQTYMRDMHYTSISQAGFNLAYSAINVGLVGLPFVAYEAGVPLFACFVLCFALVSIYTTCILIEMAQDVKARSLEELGEKAFGPRGYFFTCAIQVFFSVLLICITLNVWGDIVPELMRRVIGGHLGDEGFLYFALTNRKSVIILGSLVVLPVCFVRSLVRLSWPSLLSVCAITIAVTFVVIVFFRDAVCLNCGYANKTITPHRLWWSAQAVICFCFTFQQKLFFVYNCLRRRSVSRMRPAVVGSHTLVAAMYLLFGALGAMNAASEADDDGVSIKYNFFSDYESVNGPRLVFDVTRAVVAVSLLCTVPMDCLVAVTSWRRLRRRYARYRRSLNWTSGNPEDEDEGARESLLGGDGIVAEEGGDVVICCVEMTSLTRCLRPNDDDGDRSVADDRMHSREPLDKGAAWDAKTSVTASTSTAASSVMYAPTGSSRPALPPRSPHSRALARTRTADGCESPCSTPRVSFRGLPNTERDIGRSVIGDDTGDDDSRIEEWSRAPPGSGLTSNHSCTFGRDSDSVMSGYSFGSGSNAATVAWGRQGQGQTRQSWRSTQFSELDDNASLQDSVTDASEDGWREAQGGIGNTPAVRRRLPDFFSHGVPVLAFWTLALCISLTEENWIIWAVVTSTFITSTLVFFLPSMIYFRLGVKSDFQSIPYFGSCLPNRLYMFIVQLLGILSVLGNIAGWVVLSMTKDKGHM